MGNYHGRSRRPSSESLPLPRDFSTNAPTYTEGNGNFWAHSNYGWNEAIFTHPWVTWNPRYTLLNITDGTSNTIMFGEQYALCNGNNRLWAYYAPWNEALASEFHPPNLSQNPGANSTPPSAVPQLAPTVAQCNVWDLQAMDQSGTLVGMCDGSTRLVSTAIGGTTWYAAMFGMDGMVLGSDW